MRNCICIVILSIVSIVSAFSQADNDGITPITEGRIYVVAFPQVWAETTEKPLSTPMSLIISSQVATTAYISTPAAENSSPRIDKFVQLSPNVPVRVAIPMSYMNQSSGLRNGFGIRVSSPAPITVFTEMAWNGNGEMARHFPVNSWGTAYYTMNVYLDRFGNSTSYKYRPAQYVLISNQDSTVIRIESRMNLELDQHLTLVSSSGSNKVYQATLSRFETMVVKPVVDESQLKEFTTDPSGSLITSNNPIAVVSGHTKGAIMRMPDVLPPTGIFAAAAHFLRNNVHDAMLPNQLAGKEFVTVPCMYTSTRVTGQTVIEYGIDDDRGDVIRVIALENNTTIKRMRQDGSGMINVWKINKGETRIESATETASCWTSDKPIMMGQYGKSYAKILPPDVSKDGNATQGHPTVEAGMPMLMTVPSTDRWVTHGVFQSPEGLDNFLSIVFNVNSAQNIMIDEKALQSAWGGSLRLIPGTEYAYIRTPIAAGSHTITSTEPDAKWMAWTYGSLDGLQQGRSYGTPVAVDLSIASNDIVSVDALTSNCSTTGVSHTESATDTNAAMHDVYMVSGTNFSLDVSPQVVKNQLSWALTPINQAQDATATLRMASRSGRFIERTYTYTADKVSVTPTTINFGNVQPGTPVCDTIVVRNESDTRSLTIQQILAKNFPDIYSILPTTFTLPPGASQSVVICVVVSDVNPVKDTIITNLACYGQPSVAITINGITDVEESETDARIVYPMPVVLSEHSSFSVRVPASATSVRIHDALGKVVYTSQVRGEETLSIATRFLLSAGLYGITFSTSDGDVVVPLVCFD